MKPTVRKSDGHDTFQHTLLDIETTAARRLNARVASRLISEAAHVGGLKVIRISSHQFAQHSFTAFALLSQSHIAIHTWPEFDYVACDVFSCGGEMRPVVQYLLKSLSPAAAYERTVPRGIPSRGRIQTVFVDDTGPGIRTLMDVALVARRKSHFQDIQVLRHRKFGKMLVINDDVQFAESDFAVYDEALLGPLPRNGNCQNILVVGGGDGLCCTYLLRKKIGSRIEVLELDPAVPEICLRYFNGISDGLVDSRVHITFGDAVRSIRSIARDTFDAVVIDTTAPDTKWGRGTYSREFLSECKRVLKVGGVLTMNGTSIWYDYDCDASDIKRNVSAIFGQTTMAVSLIPSFGSPWAFFTAVKRARRA